MVRQVETHYCPTTELPEDYLLARQKKRKRFEDKDNDNSPENDRKIFQKMFHSVKEFGLTNIQTSKKKILDDKLTKLGAPPPKQQKVPFKMKMGILEGRKKREKRHQVEARESGQVLAIKKKKNADIRGPKKSLNRDQQQPDWNVKTKGGVFRLPKSDSKSKRESRRR